MKNSIGKILIILNITAILIIGILLVPKDFWTVKSSDSKEVLGVSSISDSLNQKFVPLKICTPDICQIISAEDISSLYTSGTADKNKVYKYCITNIFPALQSFYNTQVLVSSEKGSFYTQTKDKRPDLSVIPDGIVSVLGQRETGKSVGVYNISLISLPGTNGIYSAKYIEVDDSSQTIYAWINGKVAREFSPSSPLLNASNSYGVFSLSDTFSNLFPNVISESDMRYISDNYSSEDFVLIHE